MSARTAQRQPPTAAQKAASRHFLNVTGKSVFVAAMLAFFAIPVLWLATAPFDKTPSLSVELPQFTLANFVTLLHNPFALRSLGNSIILSLGSMVLVLLLGVLASYSLARVRIPGRDGLLYALLLLSSLITGTAAMVPTFLLMVDLHLIDTQLGVVLVLTGGVLPTVIFILKDFMDSIPKSYEESARLYGASPMRVLWDVVIPVARPGLGTVAVWSVVQVWGNFLIPYILLRSQDKQPAAVVMYTFYTEGGQPNLALISTFALIFSIPVIVMYFFVSRRYGFRFHGGIKN